MRAIMLVRDVVEKIHNQSGEIRLYMQCEFKDPLQLIEINVTKQPTPVLNVINQLKGKEVAASIEHREFNGAKFWTLVNGGNFELVKMTPFVSALPPAAKVA
jgi:hypothetical protein